MTGADDDIDLEWNAIARRRTMRFLRLLLVVAVVGAAAGLALRWWLAS